MKEDGEYEEWFDLVQKTYLRKYNQKKVKDYLLEDKVVVKLDKRTLEFIEEYPNVELAAKEIGVQRMELMKACEGNCTNLMGYSWLYKSLYEKLSKEV